MCAFVRLLNPDNSHVLPRGQHFFGARVSSSCSAPRYLPSRRERERERVLREGFSLVFFPRPFPPRTPRTRCLSTRSALKNVFFTFNKGSNIDNGWMIDKFDLKNNSSLMFFKRNRIIMPSCSGNSLFGIRHLAYGGLLYPLNLF